VDRAEFEAWYRADYRRLLAAVTVLARDPDRGQELTDEAFARALARCGSFGVGSNPSGWVYRVALNLLRQAGRRRAVERPVLRRAYEPPAFDPPAGWEVWDAVARLPERQRQAVALRYAADLPEAEIAAALGVTRGTVSSALADARRRLAELLGEPVEEGAP
jgi:DNA-directed RNA polymerase specialized sigma24 family protein